VEACVEKDVRAKAALSTKVGWGVRLLRWAAFLGVVGVMVYFGVQQIREKIELVKPVQFVGHSDDAAYALMGKSLSEGRGIYINYVSTFFIKYPPGIVRREDHWPPFMGMAMAPLFWVMGVSPQVARLPAICFGSIGLPLMTALLAYALSRRGYVALVAGLVMMADGGVYAQSLRTIADGTTAMLVAGFCASVVMARRRPWFYAAAGVFAACAYYAKGSELLLLALYPVLAFLAAGIGAFREKWWYAGLGVALLLLAPFWYANWREYGNPLHSTQNYVSGFYGFESWEEADYFPYWGRNLPKTSDRWEKHPGAYAAMARTQLGTTAALLLTGANDSEWAEGAVWLDFGEYGVKARDLLVGRGPHSFAALFEKRAAVPMKPVSAWQSPVWELAGVGALGLLAVAVIAMVVRGILWMWRAGRRSWRRWRVGEKVETARVGVAAPEWEGGAVMAVWLVLVVQWVFISYFWEVAPRFCFPMLPLVLALGCAGAGWLLERPLTGLWTVVVWGVQRLRRRKPVPRWAARTGRVVGHWPLVVTLALAAWVWFDRAAVYAAQNDMLDRVNARGDYPFEQNDEFIAMGKWLGKKLPHAVVMCRNPWELMFYSGPGNKGVGLPNPSDGGQKGADEIFAIARYYGVTHLLADEIRAPLEPYLVHRKPGLVRVKGSPMALFEIDWSKIPVMTVEQALGREPMPAATRPATTATTEGGHK
jgi:4-amino-4-deoxy-L-arabinose transferase-like glycosyltransferase